MYRWFFSTTTGAIAFFIILSLVGVYFNYMVFVEKFPPDGIAEECVEDIIEQHTGIKVDLTPTSREDE